MLNYLVFKIEIIQITQQRLKITRHDIERWSTYMVSTCLITINLMHIYARAASIDKTRAKVTLLFWQCSSPIFAPQLDARPNLRDAQHASFESTNKLYQSVVGHIESRLLHGYRIGWWIRAMSSIDIIHPSRTLQTNPEHESSFAKIHLPCVNRSECCAAIINHIYIYKACLPKVVCLSWRV